MSATVGDRRYKICVNLCSSVAETNCEKRYNGVLLEGLRIHLDSQTGQAVAAVSDRRICSYQDFFRVLN